MNTRWLKPARNRAHKLAKAPIDQASDSENRALAASVCSTFALRLSLALGLELQDVVSLCQVKGARSVFPDEFNGVRRRASIIDQRDCN